MSVYPSVCLTVRLSLKILVTTESIGFYSSGNIPTGPVVVLSYFLREWDTVVPKPPQSPQKNTIFGQVIKTLLHHHHHCFFLITSWGKAASIFYKIMFFVSLVNLLDYPSGKFCKKNFLFYVFTLLLKLFYSRMIINVS